MSMSPTRLLLFDGVCNLCNGVVQLVIKNDRHARFQFASLQSEAGQKLLREHGLPTQRFETFVLIEDGKVYTRSTAALRTIRQLRWPWRLLYGLIIVPRRVRDAIYDLIARSRYRLFGKRATCMVPTPELRSRFLG